MKMVQCVCVLGYVGLLLWSTVLCFQYTAKESQQYQLKHLIHAQLAKHG